MGNGAKKISRQERKKDQPGKGASSQKKTNEAAKNIICKTCFQSFLCTSREKALSEHAENKHSKTVKECFGDWAASS
ncbi:At2g23090 like protein [Parasitella parasitica]|nr:At2g23090 like protein [Parasitella parasitica]